jgi:hypothetical protein
MISFEHALPLLIFLVVSFLAFYFVETVILLALNFLIRRYWKFVVDSLLHTIVRHAGAGEHCRRHLPAVPVHGAG